VKEQHKGSKPKNFPFWAYRTRREFRKIKRAEFKNLERAFSKFRFGSAYFPGYKHMSSLEKSLKDIRTAVRTEWGKS
jgi:hypothetical protein